VVFIGLSSFGGATRAQPVEFGPGGEEAPSEEQQALDSRDVVLMASRSVQTVQEAPMIVTIITREEIRQGGYRTVEEILRTVPGFEETAWQEGRTGQILTRGQVKSLLFMINGTPYYTFVYNTPYDVGRALDVQMIEKIEIVSGPGGVLWGAGALLGIVNVITRDAPERGAHQEASVGGGDGPGEREVLRAFARSSSQLGSLGSFNLMLSYVQARGPEYEIEDSVFVGPPPFVWDQNLTFLGNTGTTETHATSRFMSAMANLTLGDFQLFGYVPWTSRAHDIGAAGGIVSGDNLETDLESIIERLEPMTFLRFKRRFMEDRFGIQVTGSAQFHNWNQEADPERCEKEQTECGFVIHAPNPSIAAVPPGGLAFNNRDRTRRIGIATELDAVLPARNNLIWGIDLYNDWGLEYFGDYRPTPAPIEYAVPPSNRTTFNAFIRDEWRLVDPLALSGGLRYVGSDQYDPFLVGEAAAVWNITGALYARGAYAEGFRAPALEALYSIQGPGAFGGNPNLESESSRAVEGELNWVTLRDVGPFSKLYLRLDYSYTQLHDIVEQVSGQYFNRGQQDLHSVELLSRLDLTNGSSFRLAYYYIRAVDEQNGVLRIPANHILTASLSLRLLPWLDLTSVFTAVGPRESPGRVADLPGQQASMNSVVMHRLDEYYLLRAGLLVHDIPVNVVRDFELRVFGDNLLDQRYKIATLQGDKNEGTPAPRPGWAIFADLTYRLPTGGATR